MSLQTSTTFAMAIVVAVAVFAPATVSAQDDDDEILDLPPGIIPGLNVTAKLHGGGLGNAPDTPIDPYFVTIPENEVNVTIPGAPERRVCEEGKIGLGDHLECEYNEEYVLTSACDTTFKTLRLIPIFGAPIADTLEEAAREMDEEIHNLTQNPPEGLPDELKDTVKSAYRNNTLQELIECTGTIQSVSGQLASSNVSLNVELGVSIPLCLHSGIQEPLGLCFEPVENTSAVQETVEGRQIPILTNSCRMENLTMDCGKINETGEEIDPFEQWNEVVGKLESRLRVEINLNEHDQILPGTSDGTVQAKSGEYTCGHGGLPPNDDGDMFARWWLYGDARLEGGQLPQGLEEQVNPFLKEVFDTVNEEISSVSNTWNTTMEAIVETINEEWEQQTGDEGLGLNSDRDGDITASECRVRKDPSGRYDVPKPTHPSLP